MEALVLLVAMGMSSVSSSMLQLLPAFGLVCLVPPLLPTDWGAGIAFTSSSPKVCIRLLFSCCLYKLKVDLAVITLPDSSHCRAVITSAYYSQCRDEYLLSYIVTTTGEVQLGLGILFSPG